MSSQPWAPSSLLPQGAVPFLVSATSGTTALGAFDALEAIADMCQHHGLGLHVDAAWGGSILLSQTHRHLLAGIQRADSVAWNPHKLLSTGLQCSALLRDTSNLLKGPVLQHSDFVGRSEERAPSESS